MTTSQIDFLRWTKELGFRDYNHFVKSTGVEYSDIKGEWFQLLGGRIYTKTKLEMKQMEADNKDWLKF
jgi:hypothetical protein